MRRPPSGQLLDVGERQVVDVDQPVGPRDAGADQVDLGRAAGEERARRVARRERDASSTVAARV